MTETLIKGMVKTIIDGIKDAQMQCEYADEAMEHGEKQLYDLHMAELKKRLSGVEEWYKKANELFPNKERSPVLDIFTKEYKDWYQKLKHKAETYKMG